MTEDVLVCLFSGTYDEVELLADFDITVYHEPAYLGYKAKTSPNTVKAYFAGTKFEIDLDDLSLDDDDYVAIYYGEY